MGVGYRVLETRSVLDAGPPARTEGAVVASAAALGLELGLDEDRLLLGVAGGVSWPAGLGEDDRQPAVRIDVRAGWRLWSDPAGAALYLEPRVELFAAGVPGGAGFGGAVSARFRVDWFDVGLRFGGLDGGEGVRKVASDGGVEERLVGLSGTLFLGVSPRLAAW